MQVITITESGLIRTGNTFVNSINLVAGSDAASIVLNNSLDGSGDDVGAVKTAANASQESLMHGTICQTGIYATLTGTDATAYLYIS